ALDALAARQQFALLGSQPASVLKGAASPVSTNVLVSRDVEVVIDNGLAVTRGTVISLLDADVGTLRQADVITIHPDDAERRERFTVSDIISDDGVVTEVHVRG